MPQQSRNNNENRPKLPAKLERELWARAAGRCEFRGCNKLLYKDDLTQKRDNLATISHIISYKPGGPRGHPVLSRELARDITNLMLTCRDHGKIIDSKEYEDEYTIETLVSYKKEHEKRVRIVTGLQDSFKTHVLLLQVPIAGRRFTIDQMQAFQAIRPRYPAAENAILIDLIGVPLKENEPNYWTFMAECITAKTSAVLQTGADEPTIKHLSVFALAPIPLLVHFGTLLGDITTIDLYQHHRGIQDWSWQEEELAQPFYEINRPREEGKGKDAAIAISVSRRIDHDLIAKISETDANVYEIVAQDCGLDFLKSRKRLEIFGYEYRNLLREIQQTHGHGYRIHLFGAMPAPIAIECGRSLLAKSDPPVLVYDHSEPVGYQYALTVNLKRQ